MPLDVIFYLIGSSVVIVRTAELSVEAQFAAKEYKKQNMPYSALLQNIYSWGMLPLCGLLSGVLALYLF
jgi:hypothetical protein